MEMEHTLSLKDIQGFEDGTGPDPAVSEVWCHCGIPLPITCLRRYFRSLELAGDYWKGPGPEPAVMALLPGV